jgi:hypothetical protein
MVKEVKRDSSLCIKTKGADLRDFAWQRLRHFFNWLFTNPIGAGLHRGTRGTPSKNFISGRISAIVETLRN